MPNRSKRIGDEAEREIARLLADATGWPIERKLGAGRKEDTGDLYGIPNTTVQVKNRPHEVLRALRECLDDLPRQQANAGTTFGMGFVRRPRGLWVAVCNVDQACTWMREAIQP